MTLEELGQATSIGYKHIAGIERGEKAPSFEAIDRLAKALGVPPYRLFLPHGENQAKLDQSLQKVIREVEGHSSPPVKRLLLAILSLVHQLEVDLPEKAKVRLTESADHRNVLGPITVLTDPEPTLSRKDTGS